MRKRVAKINEDSGWEDLEKISERTNVGTGDSDGESEKCSTKKRGDNQLTRKRETR